MVCPQCGEQNVENANFCGKCGRQLRAVVAAAPDPRAGAGAGGGPAFAATPVARQEKGDDTGGVIPYKNVPALVGYYLGVFSLIPCLGLPLGIAAVPLGVAGLRKRRMNPVIKGGVHAWVAIVLGALSTLLWGGTLAVFFLVKLG